MEIIHQKETHTICFEREVRLPSLPNFILLGDESSDEKICISELTDDQLRNIAEEWGEALIEKAAKRRKGKAE